MTTSHPPTALGSDCWQIVRRDGSRFDLVLHRATGFLERLRGLLGTALPTSGHGLWLDPCRAVHSFGMRDAIDVLFVDSGGRLVAVREHLAPWRTAACRRASSTIEMRAGEARRLRIEPGSVLVTAQPGPPPRFVSSATPFTRSAAQSTRRNQP